MFSAMGYIAYLTATLGKPVGTFGAKKMLEGEDAWANDDQWE